METRKKRSDMSSQSPGNKMAQILDDRRFMSDEFNRIKQDLAACEMRLKVMIMKDPVGFESCITVNWRKLERMFGG